VFFVFILAIVCGVLFSLPPALRATKADLTPSLKEGSALQMPGYHHLGLRNILIVGQIAGSLMLLLITGFLVIGLSHVSGVKTKFDARTLYLFSIDPARNSYTIERAQALFDKLPDQLKSSPAVRSVSIAGQAPFSLQEANTDVTAENPQGGRRTQIRVVKQTVGAGYFAALSEPPLSGREFVDLDESNEPGLSKYEPAIINESASHGLFGRNNPIGQHFRDGRLSCEVVGVVHDLKNGIGISQRIVYLPLTKRDFSQPPADGITFMVLSDASNDVLSTIRRQVAFVDPSLNVFNVRTLAEELERSRSYERFAINTYGGIGIFGLILAAVGLAGVTAYAVAQRGKEIGIRLALGATKRGVLLLVLREGSALVLVGTALGVFGAFSLAKILSALANAFVEALQVGTTDPRLIVGAPLLLALLALLACYVPARRATKVDVLKALRQS
jgi:predicted permease